MFKDLRDKIHNLVSLAKEAKMETHQFIEQNEQVKLFRLLGEYDKLNIAIGHAQYMTKYFDNQLRSTKSIRDFTNYHQAMLLTRQHLNELRAQRDEMEGHIAYLKSAV